MIYLSYVLVAYDLFVSVEPDFRLAGESLFFAWPKKSNQKKGRDQLGPPPSWPAASLRYSVLSGGA